MSFVWPLGLAFAALLPLVVALYFLKLRRVPKIVSSTYIWKRAVDEFRVIVGGVGIVRRRGRRSVSFQIYGPYRVVFGERPDPMPIFERIRPKAVQ